jgi:hypothetical protein
MTTDSTTTAADVLLGAGEHTAAFADLLGPQVLGTQDLGAALRGTRVLAEGTRNVAEREINAAASRLLDIDLSDVLIGGWLRYEQLRRAAANTRNGGCECVPLARHRVNATHRPWIELRVNDVPIGRIDFEIRTTLEIDGVTAVVEHAALQKLRYGECNATVAVTITPHGQTAQRSRKLPVGQVIQLRDPIPLLGSYERATVPTAVR